MTYHYDFKLDYGADRQELLSQIGEAEQNVNMLVNSYDSTKRSRAELQYTSLAELEKLIPESNVYLRDFSFVIDTIYTLLVSGAYRDYKDKLLLAVQGNANDIKDIAELVDDAKLNEQWYDFLYELYPEMKPIPEPEPEPEPELAPEPETEPEPVPAPQPEPEPEPVPVPQPEKSVEPVKEESSAQKKRSHGKLIKRIIIFAIIDIIYLQTFRNGRLMGPYATAYKQKLLSTEEVKKEENPEKEFVKTGTYVISKIQFLGEQCIYTVWLSAGDYVPVLAGRLNKEFVNYWISDSTGRVYKTGGMNGPLDYDCFYAPKTGVYRITVTDNGETGEFEFAVGDPMNVIDTFMYYVNVPIFTLTRGVMYTAERTVNGWKMIIDDLTR